MNHKSPPKPVLVEAVKLSAFVVARLYEDGHIRISDAKHDDFLDLLPAESMVLFDVFLRHMKLLEEKR